MEDRLELVAAVSFEMRSSSATVSSAAPEAIRIARRASAAVSPKDESSASRGGAARRSRSTKTRSAWQSANTLADTVVSLVG